MEEPARRRRTRPQDRVYPAEARFRWNVEGLWSVESYLRQASARRTRGLRRAVRRERSACRRTTRTSSRASPPRKNSAAGPTARAGCRRGTAVGPDALGHAQRHPRAELDGGRPRWRRGRAVLQQRAQLHARLAGRRRPHRHDAEGARRQAVLVDVAVGRGPLALLDGRARLLVVPRAQHRRRVGARSEKRCWITCRSLADAGYAYDMVQVRYTIGGDNGPVDPNLPDFVRAWNEQFATPRLVINTADAMFAEFERRHGAALPVMSGDMTPYWEDGALSSAAEETSVRAARRAGCARPRRCAALRRVRLPSAASRGSVAQRAPLARTHLGRRRQHQPAGSPGRRRPVGIQATIRDRGRPAVARPHAHRRASGSPPRLLTSTSSTRCRGGARAWC